MKKIILILLVLFSLNVKVKASDYEVYYSNYSDYSEFSEKEINGSELIDVQTERRYRFYEEKIEGEYLKYELGENKYSNIDYNNYILTEFSKWQDTLPSSDKYRVIETKEIYKVKKLKPIQGLMFVDFSFNKDIVKLGEIEIYVNDKKIEYDSICGDCDLDDRYNKNGFTIIDFYEPYYLEDIIIKIPYAEQDYIKDFTIFAIEPGDSAEGRNIYASYQYDVSDKNLFSISTKDFKIVNPRYEEEIIYDEVPNVSNLDYVELIYNYRYQDKYYYFYDVNKEYIDGYFVDYPGGIRDEENYKDYYRYRTREKIVVENKMTITRYKENLEDFIISTINYEIETNINYLENGIYSVRYVTPFQTIEKEVIVDIEENDFRKELELVNKKYDELIIEYKDSQNQINELKKFIDIKDERIKDLEKVNFKNKEQLLNEYNLNDNTELESLTKEKEQCNNELDNIKLKNNDNEKKLKLSNQANEYLEKTILDIKNKSIKVDKNNIVSFIFIGLLIVLIIIIIKKMSIKN